jgi:superfamily II DNA or RNA helicase
VSLARACGLGKTLIELEAARLVAHRTGGRVLIVTKNELVGDIIAEGRPRDS